MFNKKVLYYTIIIFCAFTAQAYKQARWSSIKKLTRKIDFKNPGLIKRVLYSMLFRSQEKERNSSIDKILKTQIKAKNKKVKKGDKKKYNYTGGKDMFAKARKNLNSYLPMVVMNTLRILLGLQAYMYNNSFSFIHLIWVLFSFVFPYKVTQFMTIMIMIPLYTSEFVMIYGSRIPIVKD